MPPQIITLRVGLVIYNVPNMFHPPGCHICMQICPRCGHPRSTRTTLLSSRCSRLSVARESQLRCRNRLLRSSAWKTHEITAQRRSGDDGVTLCVNAKTAVSRDARWCRTTQTTRRRVVRRACDFDSNRLVNIQIQIPICSKGCADDCRLVDLFTWQRVRSVFE